MCAWIGRISFLMYDPISLSIVLYSNRNNQDYFPMCIVSTLSTGDLDIKFLDRY